MFGSAMSLFSLIMARISRTFLFRAQHITAATTGDTSSSDPNRAQSEQTRVAAAISTLEDALSQYYTLPEATAFGAIRIIMDSKSVKAQRWVTSMDPKSPSGMCSSDECAGLPAQMDHYVVQCLKSNDDSTVDPDLKTLKVDHFYAAKAQTLAQKRASFFS